MQQRELDPAKVRALLVTHEHTDHARGARVLSKRLDIPVYLTEGTYLGIQPLDRPENSCFIKSADSFNIEGFHIHSFPKNHDAEDPCSFRIEYKHTCVGVFTDIGEACENVRYHLEKCNAVFIESNYDEEMLWAGPYPFYLKRRVSSEVGHLSNEQSLQLITNHAGEQLEHVFLSHLSGENNTPGKAYQHFSSLKSRYNIHLTSREDASYVIRIE